MLSFCRIPATRSRSAAVARTVAAAGLFSSCIRPEASEPSAASRCRSPITAWLLRIPKNSPSSRCIAIGNHSRTRCPKSSADSTKKVQSLTAFMVARYRRSKPGSSRRYACVAPMYAPRWSVRAVSISSCCTLRDSARVPVSRM